ncbi:Uncharacterised protein [Mycobacteroides abscessus subsp. abscessus]|nr:Uncharacterised protein [Mycobacteroides abscessus subsp. abscessus]
MRFYEHDLFGNIGYLVAFFGEWRVVKEHPPLSDNPDRSILGTLES